MKDNTIQHRTALYNLELENLTIGELLLTRDSINEVIPIIGDKDIFYFDENKAIWNQLKKIHENNMPLDITTFYQNKNINKESLLHKLTLATSSVNVKFHAIKLYELYVKRQLHSLLLKNEKALENDENDISDIYSNIENEMSSIFDININNGAALNDIVTNTLISIKKKIEGKDFPRIYTNTVFDQIINFSAGELIWLAGVPKASKTRTIAYILYNLYVNNKNNIAIRWFSMEDSANVVLSYMVATKTNIPFDKIIISTKDDKPNEKEFSAIENAMNEMREYNIFISYGSENIDKVYSQSKSFIKKNKDKMNIIVIDNFNILVRNQKGKGTRLEKEEIVSGKIQKIKIDTNNDGYNTIIIVLDHLNKEALTRDRIENGFRPELKDLKGSGGKLEVLTQLITINKPNLYPKLLEQQSLLPNKVYSNGVIHRRIDVLKKLIIYENLMSRNKTDANIIRMVADLNSFKFYDYEEVKNYKKQ